MNFKLKTKRNEIGLTQVQVANKSKISTRQYQSIEAKECIPNVNTAMRIAYVLDTTVEELFKDNLLDED